jgi:hypothetical protein
MTVSADERVYRLEPLDASGVFLGLGVAQCALLGIAMLLAVLIISAGLPVPVAGLPLACAATGSFARIGGHIAWEWLPLGIGWLWSGISRGRRWTAPLPLWPVDADRPPPLPPCLAGLDVAAIPWRAGAELGAVRDTEAQTLTALVPVPGAKFVAEAWHEQERLLAGWGDVLSQFATEQTAVTHVAWSDLARPSGMQAHLAWLPDSPRGEPVLQAMESYNELLEVGAMTAMTHDVVVSLTVGRDRLGRRRGASDAQDRLLQAMVGAVEALLRGLRSAGLAAETPLDAAALHRLLRIRVDPTRGLYPSGGRLAERLGLLAPSAAGPLIVEASWRSVRIDGAWHRTWWVGSWPRLGVPPSWLEPFLSADGVTRTMTVTMLPVPTHQSRRRIARDLVKLESDAATKEEHGRRVDARHRRATEALLEREQELVAGFAEMAYAGLVSVAATSEEELEEHSQIVEQLAHECGMDLRVLDGRQDLGWAAALPLGLAPRGLLAG